MISSSVNRISYNGNGSATEFTYPFKILDRTDIKVMLVDKDGNETVLTKDYYVDMDKNVILYPGYAVGAEPPESERPAVLADGWRLVLYRDVPITQEAALEDFWPFSTIEGMADKLTIICQQLAELNERCFKLSVAQDFSKINLNLPVGAGKSFAWNDDATQLVLTDDPADVIPMVNERIEYLQNYIIDKTNEITALVESLQSLTKEELQGIRDECAQYAKDAENAALVNVRYPTSELVDRDASLPTYGIENADLIVLTPEVLKIDVDGNQTTLV